MERDHVLLERARRALWTRILAWSENSVDDHQADHYEEADCPSCPEDESLMLPSSSCGEGWPPQASNTERRLRQGQANDALKAIRTLLSQKLVLRRDKRLNIRGTTGITRSNLNLARIEREIQESAERYRRAYSAMLRLGMPDTDKVYHHLNDKDLTYSNVFDKDRPLGRGYEDPVSWIWHMQESGGRGQLDDNWLEEGEGSLEGLFITNSP
jgi:hypothetical protein